MNKPHICKEQCEVVDKFDSVTIFFSFHFTIADVYQISKCLLTVQFKTFETADLAFLALLCCVCCSLFRTLLVLLFTAKMSLYPISWKLVIAPVPKFPVIIEQTISNSTIQRLGKSLKLSNLNNLTTYLIVMLLIDTLFCSSAVEGHCLKKPVCCE